MRNFQREHCLRTGASEGPLGRNPYAGLHEVSSSPTAASDIDVTSPAQTEQSKAERRIKGHQVNTC